MKLFHRKKVGILLIMLTLTIAILFPMYLKPTEAALEEEEIKAIIHEQYTGTIIRIEKLDTDGGIIYVAQLDDNDRNYTIEIDAYSGDIVSVLQNDKKEDRVQETSPLKNVISLTELNEIIHRTIDGETVIVSVLLNDESNVYRVEGHQMDGSFFMEVDAFNGALLLYRVADELETEIKEPETEQTLLTEEEAIVIALSNVEGEIDDVELIQQNGRSVYEVEIEVEDEDMEAYVYIDAYSGELLNIIWED
ncbi:PepSY domain-containing protein [Sutcliffiella cohnii]|uniref:PepSY domain-containing protein n=1 Tax=Sutcliffiella cohnii TaxID=33932 RepID=UPI002E1C303A|nr:PepSY domain-containing protein [Sutcliffiella cohnii]